MDECVVRRTVPNHSILAVVGIAAIGQHHCEDANLRIRTQLCPSVPNVKEGLLGEGAAPRVGLVVGVPAERTGGLREVGNLGPQSNCGGVQRS